MDQNKILRNIIHCKNYDETLDIVTNEIEKQESELKTLTTQHHEEIINNCAYINNLECKNGLKDLTEKINNYAFTLCLNYKKAAENDLIVKKCTKIHFLVTKLNSIFEGIEKDDDNFKIFLKYSEIVKEIKFFKKCSFYENIKFLMQNKRFNLTCALKEQINSWLGNIFKLYNTLGSKILNNREIQRSDLLLTNVLECLYIFRKLDAEEEFYDFFNSKRQKIAGHLRFYEMIGFLNVEKNLLDIDQQFMLRKLNFDFDKEELILLIKYLEAFGFESKEAKQKLDKICCDFIIENRENINSKSDIDFFIQKSELFLANVLSPPVIEFYYKVVDDSVLKFYDDAEIENKINKVHQFKTSTYKFKSLDKMKEIRDIETEKIKCIFEQGKYENLNSVLIDKENVEYIRNKFILALNETNPDQARVIEKYVIDFYIFLKGYKQELASVFYDGLINCEANS